MDNLSYLSDTELFLAFVSVLVLIGGVWFIGWLIYQMIQSQIWENRLEAEDRRAKREAELTAARERREYLADIRQIGFTERDLKRLPPEQVIERIHAATDLHRRVIEGLTGHRPSVDT